MRLALCRVGFAFLAAPLLVAATLATSEPAAARSCEERYRSCTTRCLDSKVKDSGSCMQRTCLHQEKMCRQSEGPTGKEKGGRGPKAPEQKGGGGKGGGKSGGKGGKQQ